MEEQDFTIKWTDTVRVSQYGNKKSKMLMAPIRKYLKEGLRLQKEHLIEITVRNTGVKSITDPNLLGRMDKQMKEMEGNNEEEASI